MKIFKIIIPVYFIIIILQNYLMRLSFDNHPGTDNLWILLFYIMGYWVFGQRLYKFLEWNFDCKQPNNDEL